MLRKAEALKTSFSRFSLVIILALFITTAFAGTSHAAGEVSGNTSQDLLSAPAVGSNVIAYLFAEFIGPKYCHTSIFVRKCEAAKRIDTDQGVLVSHTWQMTLNEFNAIDNTVLFGMADPDGQLSMALSNGQALIAVVERVLEYKKVGNRFVARLSLKFVSETP